MEKKYMYSWEDENEGKCGKDMITDILADEELEKIDSIVIGNWGDAWDSSGAQEIVDGIVENKEKFQQVKSLFIGDMEYDECEVSWILQANYSKLWEALPGLEHLTIKGSCDLCLGEQISHENLKSLTIICGGLPKQVFETIQKAKLPALEKLVLYIGIDNYGFDGDIKTICTFLNTADFPKLKYLGLVDSEIQDEVTEAVLQSKFMDQIETLELSMGSLTDKGGAQLLEAVPKYPNIKALDLHYHYLSDEMVSKLEALPITVDCSDPQEADEWDGEIWMNAMLTE